MYKLRKDKTKLIMQWKLKAGKKHYFHVFLWEDQESFDQNVLGTEKNECIGCCNLAPTIISFKDNKEAIIRPKLGEIHFIKDEWNLEIVAHELCHGLIQRLRMIEPRVSDVVEQIDESEEIICHEFGKWVYKVYNSLWESNPNLKWSKKEGN